MKTVLLVLFFLLLLLGAIYAGAGHLLGLAIRRKGSLHKATANQNVMGEGWEVYKAKIESGYLWYDETPYEPVEITSFDGLRLKGRYFLHEKNRRQGTVVMFHGYRSSGRRDLSYAGMLLFEAGYDILIVDQRSHGLSEGKYICLGQAEGQDAADWAAFADRRQQGRFPVFLYGISMGATTVMMASGKSLPAQVRGMVADCGFSSPSYIVKHMLKKGFHLPVWPFYHLANGLFRLKTKCNFNFSTADVLRRTSLPILLIHGSYDRFVSPDMSRENLKASAAKEKRLYMVEGAAHGQSIYAETEGIMHAVLDFYRSAGK